MPELPDVEAVRRRLASTALRQRIDHVAVRARRILGNTSAARVESRLTGHAFTDTRRHGKHLFLAIDSGDWLDVHFGLTGDFQYFADSDPDPAHDRLTIDFVHGGHLGYYDPRMFGEINLIDDPARFIAGKPLGPDALDPRLDYASFSRALGSSRALIKAALMDQRLIAGIGNVYSDEILFQARIHPESRVNALDEAARSRLYHAMKSVLKIAVEREAEPERMPKHFLLSHRRAGVACPRCGGKVARRAIGGRSSYYCPQCQSKP